MHTGHWGCGAYGGSRPLTALLQAVAARLAGVSLVYHAFDEAGVAEVESGLETLDAIVEALADRCVDSSRSVSMSALVAEMVGRDFVWGQSDGN